MNPTRGIILVNAPMTTDTGDYNLTVVATDNGSPPLSGEAIVYIRMIRNLNAPIFATNYTESVSEYADIGHRVVRVSASDADLPSSPSGQLTYELATGLTTGAIDYFSIGTAEDAGVISVNRSLRQFPTNDMYFRVIASDGGVPQKSAVSYITIRCASY